MSNLQCIASNRHFGGWHKRYTHDSTSTQTAMTFAVYLPPQAENRSDLPVVYFLSGLTCTDENVMQKSGIQRVAAELGIVIVAPDTSPRGEGVADDPDGAYDLGLGAGFYINATQAPWDKHYRMYDYIVDELPALIEANFPVSQQRSICGHSMGGHGALMIALKNSQRYCSVSAFSPITNPSQCAWGQKAFSNYLGDDQSQWLAFDSCELVKQCTSTDAVPMLVDQGEADDFYPDQLLTSHLIAVTEKKHYPAQIRLQSGYDHSYYFIASFIEEHLRFHSRYLTA